MYLNTWNKENTDKISKERQRHSLWKQLRQLKQQRLLDLKDKRITVAPPPSPVSWRPCC
jgi:hypothetical protein